MLEWRLNPASVFRVPEAGGPAVGDVLRCAWCCSVMLHSSSSGPELSQVTATVSAVRESLFPTQPAAITALRSAVRLAGEAFAAECRAINEMVEQAQPEHREFVSGELACVLHVAPATALSRLGTALAMTARPRLLAAVEHGVLAVPHALAVLAEISHLEAAHGDAVLEELLGPNDAPLSEPVGQTPGELRAASRRAIIRRDPAAAAARRRRAAQQAGVRGRPGLDGMGQVIIDCTATEMARALAAIDGRADALAGSAGPDGQELTVGQRRLQAFLHAVGADQVRVQAVIECPVEPAVDLHDLARAGVWSVDVRMPAAVALGLSDHPAVLAGYGPIDAHEARALLPDADLVKACVDRTTGEVLAVDPPVRARTWASGDPDAARALRDRLITMVSSTSSRPDLTVRGYVPTEALGRLVDLRDVTSTFPGDRTPARRCDRDHRLPYPLGPTSEANLQNLPRHWHRAKHSGWRTRLLPDGTTRWTAPSGQHYDRPPRRTPPPSVPPGATLPPLPPPAGPADAAPTVVERDNASPHNASPNNAGPEDAGPTNAGPGSAKS